MTLTADQSLDITTYYQLPEWHGYGVTTPDWEKALAAARVRLDKIQTDNVDHDMLVPLVVTIDERTRTTVRDAEGTMVRGTDEVSRRYKLTLESS